MKNLLALAFVLALGSFAFAEDAATPPADAPPSDTTMTKTETTHHVKHTKTTHVKKMKHHGHTDDGTAPATDTTPAPAM
jgi:opacity protein-like surface antigen